MTNYQLIKQAIECGHKVEIKYCRNPIFQDLDNFHLTEQELNALDIADIKITPNKPKVLKVGQKVKILDCSMVGNYDDWRQERKAMVGKVFEIKRFDDNGSGICYYINEYPFPHYVVMPVEDEIEEEVPEYTMSELIEKLGYNFKIKK